MTGGLSSNAARTIGRSEFKSCRADSVDCRLARLGGAIAMRDAGELTSTRDESADHAETIEGTVESSGKLVCSEQLTDPDEFDSDFMRHEMMYQKRSGVQRLPTTASML